MQCTSLPRRLARWLLAAGFVAGAAAAIAQPLPSARPEDLGFSPERLARLGHWLEAEVAARRIPGAVVLVVRKGKAAYYQAVGQQDPATQRPMARDSIFRIYSMTKPLVSVATMMMVEEGRLLLEAPVARYIPSFADVKVGVEPGACWKSCRARAWARCCARACSSRCA